MAESAALASDPKRLFRKLDGILALTDQIPTRSTADYATMTEEEIWDECLEWLTSMWPHRLNVILGDQMGAGGVIPTLVFLDRPKQSGQHGPYLIVSSLDKDNGIGDWLRQIRLFPSMKELFYFGNQQGRATMRKQFARKAVGPDFPIILTTYNMVMVEKQLLAQYDWKYVVVDEGYQLKKREHEVLEAVKRQPMDHKLLLIREPFQNNLAELWSLLNFALPNAFSSREEFDSWFDKSEKEGEEQQIEEERRALLSKLHAILRPFLLRDMKGAVQNTVPQNKGATCYKTKVVRNSVAISITCSGDNATKEGAKTDGESCQEVSAEVVGVTDGEGSPNTQIGQLGLEVEVNKVSKRPRTNDAPISPLGESNPAVHVQVPNSSSPEIIFKALKNIPDLARIDILRAYSALIRDDRRFESLMALPMDMRKDWLLMEIGNN
ncbi:hypothetical protein CFC21_013547 [Triticum aestivum]|uniref:Helicase ATP-binding domain-containing protein n=3 Tax=Triticum aestivum TaxID=4565 RepID=A0A9R1DSB7_WHEAT|nr:ATP-dependent DNA helicase DDM1-like isoform X2 [Triticum aestivum]KAF6997313.1 hypothetical protein CFC21_013547 [Triticum aestivum]